MVSCSNAMIFRCFGLILLVGLDFNTCIGGLVSRGLLKKKKNSFLFLSKIRTFLQQRFFKLLAVNLLAVNFLLLLKIKRFHTFVQHLIPLGKVFEKILLVVFSLLNFLRTIFHRNLQFFAQETPFAQ